jgi:DNA-3-methyladenine glycosylase
VSAPSPAPGVRIRRVYDEPEAADGYRVLVDRLWPRGLSKERAQLDLWLKEVAPSTELRRWFHGEHPTFDAFAERYRAELDGNPALEELRAVVRAHPTVTLLVATHDMADNHARVLLPYLR